MAYYEPIQKWAMGEKRLFRVVAYDEDNDAPLDLSEVSLHWYVSRIPGSKVLLDIPPERFQLEAGVPELNVKWWKAQEEDYVNLSPGLLYYEVWDITHQTRVTYGPILLSSALELEEAET